MVDNNDSKKWRGKMPQSIPTMSKGGLSHNNRFVRVATTTDRNTVSVATTTARNTVSVATTTATNYVSVDTLTATNIQYCHLFR